MFVRFPKIEVNKNKQLSSKISEVISRSEKISKRTRLAAIMVASNVRELSESEIKEASDLVRRLCKIAWLSEEEINWCNKHHIEFK